MATEKITDLYPKGDQNTVLRPNIKSENIIDKDTLVFTSGHVPDSNLVQISISALKEYVNSNYISTSQSGTYSKTITFSDGIKVNDINNSAGNALVRYKSSEGKNVFGGSNYGCTLMGNEDRPRYSKDGSSFTGSELALKSDISTTAKNLYMHFSIFYNIDLKVAVYIYTINDVSTAYDSYATVISHLNLRFGDHGDCYNCMSFYLSPEASSNFNTRYPFTVTVYEGESAIRIGTRVFSTTTDIWTSGQLAFLEDHVTAI